MVMVKTVIMGILKMRQGERWKKEEGASMMNDDHNTNATTNNAQAKNAHMDWSRFMAQAMFEGGQAFLQAVSSVVPTTDDAQLQADENQADRCIVQDLHNARRSRTHFGPSILSAVRNWSRKQAIAMLREKVAGKPIRQDFYQPFQSDLQQEISAMIRDLLLFWEQEDEQRAAAEKQRAQAKREEAEQAYGEAYPYIHGLNDAVLHGERQRQSIFESGQQAAQSWANKYEESVKARERQLEEREKRLQEQEQENREHHIALRSLSKWDDRNSFVNTVVSTGKNTMGCLFLWFLLVAGILAAIYFAFPHH